jgi:hypothetical protein
MSKNDDDSSLSNFFGSILVVIAVVVIYLVGLKLWRYSHQSTLHSVIFWAIVSIILLILLFFFVIRRNYHFRRRYKRFHMPPDRIHIIEAAKPMALQPIISTTEDSMVSCAKQFKPRWINRNGKLRLEGGENGNNANLAQHLRDNQIPNVETEITLNNGSRADLMINNQIIIECKPHLLSVEKLHSISGEIRRVKRIGSYKVYALIYGDAKSYLLNDLKADIGENNVIVLGEVNTD